MAPPRPKPSGSNRGYSSSGGSKPLKRRYKAVKSCRKAQERKDPEETPARSLDGKKALKGEAQERWGLKKAPKDWRAKRRREGSQTLRTGPPVGTATPTGRAPKRDRAERGNPIRKRCRAKERERIPLEDGSWSA